MIVWTSFACYPRISLAGFRRYSTYRQATLAGLATNIAFGLMKVGILSAVFGSRSGGQFGGYDLATTITYVWLGQGLLSVVQLWLPLDLSERIRTGDVVIDLTRPWNPQGAAMFEEIGRAGYAMFGRFIPSVIFGVLFFPFRWPSNPFTLILFLISVALATLLSFNLRFMLSLWTFWLLDPRGAERTYAICASCLSGLEVPIVFFPDWAQNILSFTPFPALLQDPINVFVEHSSALSIVAQQAVWVVLSMIGGHLLLKKAKHKVVVQGG